MASIIKPDFMPNRMIIVIIITMGWLSYSNLLTVTGQDLNNENSDSSFQAKMFTILRLLQIKLCTVG